MTKINFSKEWSFCKLDSESAETTINLPHDAMLSEFRSEDNPGGTNIAFFSGGEYKYNKIFHIPESYKQKHIVFEFEGIYKNAEVYINRNKTASWPSGYGNCYIKADKYLNFGTDNEITVKVNNSDQPNSRWYTGSGIYRPVNMYVLETKHINLNGIKITTLDHILPTIQIDVATNHPGKLKVEIFNSTSLICSKDIMTEGAASIELKLPTAELWSPENPYLHTCRVSFEDDVVEEIFGIRTISWNPETGFCVNGERTILRGACIHHDNGLLGACAYKDAEFRKIKLMKENGYNAVRSAHNPCSKAMLEACDRLGVFMVDEYVDVWYIHKTKFDYADHMVDWWPEDLKKIVEKDYNHPSVIMYSTGNEVSETAQERGIKLTEEMTNYLHELDPTRPVTCGVNIFFNFLSSLGFGVYTDEKAEKKNNQPVGSEFYNKLAGKLGDKTMKIGATFYGCDLKSRNAFDKMDIAGYNYGILRYAKDLKKYSNRLILGTETFCNDAYNFWELAKKHKRIVGDFVWAGMDYLGEVGIGAWEYEDYAPPKGSKAGWLTAGSGRIDITGRPNAESAYTKVAFEQTPGPIIAVKPVYQTGSHSPSAWKMTDAIESWTWPGCVGIKTRVEVYARAASVKLYINGKKAGCRILRNSCRAVFQVKYSDGEITAVAYDKKEKEIGRAKLSTASEETVLSVLPETETVSPEGLVYIRFKYTDKKGILKPMEKHSIKLDVDGGVLLGFGNAGSYNPDGYIQNKCKTYYGEALAIVQAGNSEAMSLSVTDETQTIVREIPIKV